MKRTLWVLLLMVFFLSLFKVNGFTENPGDQGKRLMIGITGNYLVPADANFKKIYSNGVFYPELQARYKILRGFYLWAGYGFVSVTGETPVLKMEAKSTQHFLSAGIGYKFHLSSRFDYVSEMGVFNASYKEETLGEKLSDSAIGFRIKNGLLYRLNRTFYVEVSLGYLTASDVVDDISIKLGGFRTGIGLGAAF